MKLFSPSKTIREKLVSYRAPGRADPQFSYPVVSAFYGAFLRALAYVRVSRDGMNSGSQVLVMLLG